MNEWMVNLIQSSCVNVKIGGGREPRLMFTGNFMIVVDCLGFCKDFQLEVKVIRVMESAWHINDRTRSWSWTLTVYDANVSVSFATEF